MYSIGTYILKDPAPFSEMVDEITHSFVRVFDCDSCRLAQLHIGAQEGVWLDRLRGDQTQKTSQRDETE